MKKILRFLFVLLILLMTLPFVSWTEANAKSKKNKAADKAYLKLVKDISWEENVSVYYYLIDMTGDGVHEAIIDYHPREGGSGDIFKVYTYNNGKVNLLLDDGQYGLYQIDVYPKTQTFVKYKCGHGGESQEYYQLKNGEFKKVASKGRRTTEDDAKWGYYTENVPITETATKSEFKKFVKPLQKGKKKVIEDSSFKSYYEERLSTGSYGGGYDGAEDDSSLSLVEVNGKYIANITIYRLHCIDNLEYTQKNGVITLKEIDPEYPELVFKGEIKDGKLYLKITKSAWVYLEVGSELVFNLR